MKYRKRPVIVDAFKFTDENKNQVYAWAKEKQYNIQPSTHDGKPCLVVPTLEGEMICNLGDYLIKEPFPTDWRKFYPCKPDIFEATYEPAEEKNGFNVVVARRISSKKQTKSNTHKACV